MCRVARKSAGATSSAPGKTYPALAEYGEDEIFGLRLRTYHGHSAPVTCCASAGVGPHALIASGSRDGSCRLWQLHSAACVAVLGGISTPHPDAVLCINMSEDISLQHTKEHRVAFEETPHPVLLLKQSYVTVRLLTPAPEALGEGPSPHASINGFTPGGLPCNVVDF